MRVALAFAAPGGAQREIELEVAEGATLADALAAAPPEPALAEALRTRAGIGVWGRAKPPAHPLREGDRIEIYRALTADPKDARRAKARHGGQRN